MVKYPAFQRVFPLHEMKKGYPFRAFLCALFAAILYCAILLLLFLIFDLLTSQGHFSIAVEDISVIESIVRDPELIESKKQLDLPLEPVSFENSGILHTAWWSRNHSGGWFIAWVFRQCRFLQHNNSALITLCLSCVMLGFLRSVSLSRIRWFSTRAALEVVTRLRKSLNRQTLRLGPSDLLNESGEHALSLFHEEAETVRTGIFYWVFILNRQSVQLILLACFALCLNWIVMLQCIVPLIACYIFIRKEQKRFEYQRALGEDSAKNELRLLADNLRKTRIVRGYGMENFEHTRFLQRLERYHSNQMNVYRQERYSRWTVRILITLFISLVLFLLGIKVLVAPDNLSFSAALLMGAIFASMYYPLRSLDTLQQLMEKTELSAERIIRYRDKTPEVSQAVGAKFLDPLSQSLMFESVSYNLPGGRALLKNCDLKISAGSQIAVVSLDPIEARSLVYLLPRFTEPRSGRVLVDGEDIAWATLESLRAEIVYVGGDDPFFTGTVLENINCGNANYTLQHVTKAAKQTHAHSFILKLSQGYETMLGEHGEQLEPGEGFRLGLARAVLHNPALMIIEEPTHEIDEDTKSFLDDTYTRILKNRTVLFLPGRLSTLRKVDQIALIHHGRVQALGPYKKLVKESELFRHWEYLNYNEFR